MIKIPAILNLSTLEEHMASIEGGDLLLGEKVKVTLNDFQLCRFPVTQELWESVMKHNPSYFQGTHRPVEQISWYDAVEFCNRLSEMKDLEPVYEINKSKKDPNNQSNMDGLKWLVTQKRDATGYRLPTEAEWEFAARGGIYNRGYEYVGSDDLDEVGWYNKNSFRETLPVGLKRPNELGIYDMSGNIWEWCWDWDGAYMENPTGHISGESRVLRGGSWVNFPAYCRAAVRGNDWPSHRYRGIGFRLSRTAIERGI